MKDKSERIETQIEGKLNLFDRSPIRKTNENRGNYWEIEEIRGNFGKISPNFKN